jgi:uncharacterized protein with von Willebrand factor type A (vWA) domain
MNLSPAIAVSERLAGFAALLRDHGFVVQVAEERSMLQVAVVLGPIVEKPIQAAWRAIACHTHREWKLWPEIYDRFWHPEKTKGGVKVSGQTRPSRNLRQSIQAMHDQMDAASKPSQERGRGPASSDSSACALEQQDEGDSRSMGGASRTQALHDRDGQMWMPQDLSALQRVARQIITKLKPRPTRRWRSAPHGQRLDFRQTLRRSVGSGGEFLKPHWNIKRHEPPRLFILADVSRSMETYAALFLRVARAFTLEADARVFVFHTRLSEVTPYMYRDTPAVQEKINAVTAGFGGGTKIAASMQEFAKKHARAQLNRGSRVWVFSDGFDTDEPDLLKQSLDDIRSRGARITWFHPTRHIPGAMALKRASATIDTFIPFATLADLIAAQKHLH